VTIRLEDKALLGRNPKAEKTQELLASTVKSSEAACQQPAYKE
jgi:hypothetical protein